MSVKLARTLIICKIWLDIAIMRHILNHEHAKTKRGILASGYADAFMEIQRARNLSSYTLRGYAQSLRYLSDYADTINRNITELTSEDIRNYIVKIMGKVSPATANGRLRVYNVFYNFLRAEYIIGENPVSRVSFLKEPQKLKPVILPQQFALALRQFPTQTFCGYRDMCIALLCYDAMLRLNEALTLKIEDVQIKPTRELMVWGKGSKMRRVTFSHKTAAKLILYMHTKRKDIPGNLLFPSHDGRKLQAHNVYRSVARAFRLAGAKVKVGTHLLRHSGATQFLRNTGNLFMLKQILGHTNIKTTEIYVHASIDDIVRVYDNASPVAGLSF
jgi:site-specific recombinase XerD